MAKLTAGQTIYLKPVGNRARGMDDDNIINSVKIATVDKVGRKYFTIKEYTRLKFHLDKMHDGFDYSPTFHAYISKQDIVDELECKHLYDSIKDVFIYYFNSRNLSLDQLRRIRQIIDEAIKGE